MAGAAFEVVHLFQQSMYRPARSQSSSSVSSPSSSFGYGCLCYRSDQFQSRRSVVLKATSKKPKKSPSSGSSRSTGSISSISVSSVKGFGMRIKTLSSTNKSNQNVELDRSKEFLSFTHEFLDQMGGSGARDTMQRTTLAFKSIAPTVVDVADIDDAAAANGEMNHPPTATVFKLRGVHATCDIAKGQDIIDIPYEWALNLGPEGDDPTIPAVRFLRDYCTVGREAVTTTTSSSSSKRRQAKTTNPIWYYYQMLPPFGGNDCLASTDFYSDAALEALQSPLMVQDTLTRRALTLRRFQLDVVGSSESSLSSSQPDFPLWIDGTTPVTVEHLQWAVWIVTSRVLTVQTESPNNASVRLLIPYLDMCNHDRSSPHRLTGRAVPGGRLRVVAGAAVAAGDDVLICYGGGVTGNDKFLPEYGFLDDSQSTGIGISGTTTTSTDWNGYDIVANDLLGLPQRPVRGRSNSNGLSLADREQSLAALAITTMEQDEVELVATTDPAIRTAIRYRLGVKRALAKYAS